MCIRYYVARQPILDDKGRTFGYELLYRDDLENIFKCIGTEEDRASWKVLAHTFLDFGLNTLAFNKRVFINFTAKLLREGVPFLLPPHKLMIEILERIEDPNEILQACKRLKEEGYSLVLDDYRLDSPLEVLIPFVDYIKVDFRNTPWSEIEVIVDKYRTDLKLIAEKIETQEEFEKARDLNFKYFQGFFFARPKIITAKEIPVFKRHYIKLMSLLHSPDLDLNELVNIVNSEPSLALKLLRYINSAFFGFPTKIKSVKHAVLLLGLMGLKKWGSLISMVCLAEDRPSELVILAIIRARFMELLAQECGLGDRAEN
ncbi:EAL and HDOD domain-containing protein, partial [Thermosulfurimonas dismutans]|uniref:EAL and HDOD domain-containing protein n=1 Tax=Thermosulfurimonas dismutans TaxID=999894 RepID=UPI0008381B3F